MSPIIVCENAEEVEEHIDYYSEGQIDNWFEFFTSCDDQKYTIGLHPKLDRIYDRFRKVNNTLLDSNISIFYQPLAACCPLSYHYEQFRKSYQKANTISLSLIDITIAKTLIPTQQIDDDYILILGEFNINHNIKTNSNDQTSDVT